MDESYLRVLQMIQDGVVTAEEGEKLLDALGETPENDKQYEAAVAVLPGDQDRAGVARMSGADQGPVGPPRLWHRIWIYPLLGGVLLLVAGGLLTGSLIQAGGGLGWLACTIPLILFGALMALLVWWSTRARWLHLYVRDPKDVVRFSLPLPLHMAAWVLRLVRPWVPKLRETAVDELILALAEVDVPGNVLTVEVDDEEEGEEVRIYIG